MSARGGRGSGGLWTARARSRSVLVLAVLLAPTFLLALPPADAQVAADPWWGPSSRSEPTKGWAIRVPVTVTNHRDFVMDRPMVAADIDFGKLLAEAGWTSRVAGATTTLRGFTLDVDSIRVVEYGRGFSPGPVNGPTTEPTPHLFYPAPFEAPRHREFDAARNPAGTVLFGIDAQLQPGERRFYYVYANPLEFSDGSLPPTNFKPEHTARLESFLWGTHGTVTYGFEPQQTGRDHAIQIVNMAAGKTKVELFTYELGRFQSVPSSGALQNPFEIDGGLFRSVAVPAGKAFKLVSEKPVLVQGHGKLALTETPEGGLDGGGFLPSVTGSFSGHRFLVYGSWGDGGGAPLTLVKTDTGGSTTVFVNNEQRTLTPAAPVQPITIPRDSYTSIFSSGGPIQVFMGALKRPVDAPYPMVQVPALTGGPEGSDFIFGVPRDGGYLRVCADTTARVRVIDFSRPSAQLHPPGPIDTTAPATLAPSDACHEVKVLSTWPENLIELYTVVDGAAKPAEVSLITGATRRDTAPERGFVGHFGGVGGVDFRTTGPIGIFGYYNDTRITLTTEHRNARDEVYFKNTTFSVPRDGFQVVDVPALAEATGQARLVSNKPTSVVSVASADHPYVRFVPGRPEHPVADVGKAEFRGPLLELRSREKDGRQDFRSTGPGSPVSFPLEVANLGRWIGGEGLTDSVSLTCTTAEGWRIEGCSRSITLNSGTAERVDVVVTPPEDALNVNATIEVTARSGSGQVSSTFKLIVFVEIRYGVGMWFEVENGRKTIDPPIGLDPGETYRYNILVKNTGSAADKFDLTLEGEERSGWTHELLVDNTPVERIDLEAGASRVVQFRVKAPDTETAPPHLVTIKAQSVGSALAGDIVNSATRIRPKVDIRLDLDPSTRVARPNETAEFNLTVTNRGNNVFLVELLREGLLPAGWNSSFDREPAAIDIGPGDAWTFRLRVTPPVHARAGDLVALKVSSQTDAGGGTVVLGDQVSPVVVVRRIHNVTTPALLDAKALPGEAFDYVLPVTNHGNGADVLELLPGAVTPAWDLTTSVGQLYLELNETGELPLRVGVPQGTPAGLHNLTFSLRLSRESLQNLTIPVEVATSARVRLVGLPGAVDLAAGRTTAYALNAVNVGNVEGVFAFDARLPQGWNATFHPPTARLAPGQSIPVNLVLTAARDAPDGDADLSFLAKLDGADAGTQTAVATVARPSLALERVEAAAPASAGELLLVTAIVRNDGGIAAENVSVALVVDGDIVGEAILQRIPVGESKAATLNWLATKRSTDVRVVLDPQGDIVQVSRDAHESVVTFGSRLPVPGPALALAVLALAVVALGRRRA